MHAAIDEGVPAPVLTTALYERFSSRGEDEFANKLLSAMRKQFGGHDEKPSRGRLTADRDDDRCRGARRRGGVRASVPTITSSSSSAPPGT